MTDPTARDLIQRLADSVELLLQMRNGLTPLVITETALAEARAYLLQPVDLSHLTGDGAPTVAETSTSCIYLNTTSTEEVMRLDSQGLHYKGQFIADAGEAHQLLVAWLRRNSDEPAVPDGREPASVAYEPNEAELHDLWLELYGFHDGPTGDDVATITRAVLERWGNHAPAPIPTSERLPTEADCNAEGKCLLFGRYVLSGEAAWIYGYPAWAQRFANSYSHWLPCWALPVPGVEA